MSRFNNHSHLLAQFLRNDNDFFATSHVTRAITKSDVVTVYVLFSIPQTSKFRDVELFQCLVYSQFPRLLNFSFGFVTVSDNSLF